jgi:hypothetical protein
MRTVDIGIEAVRFGSWFGGGDASWAPSKDEYSLFRNVRLYRHDRDDSPHFIIREPGRSGVDSNVIYL